MNVIVIHVILSGLFHRLADLLDLNTTTTKMNGEKRIEQTF